MKSVLPAALVTLALMTTARAGVVTYTDVASFNAATSGNATTTFSFPSGAGGFVITPMTFGNVTFNVPSGGGALQQFNDGAYGAGVSYLAGTSALPWSLTIGGGYTAFALTLGVFGADPVIGTTVDFSINGGPGIDLPIPGHPNSRFVGFTDDVPITSIVITDVEFFTERDVLGFTTAFAATAPEPRTWTLMLIGFTALGFAGYKQARNRAVAA